MSLANAWQTWAEDRAAPSRNDPVPSRRQHGQDDDDDSGQQLDSGTHGDPKRFLGYQDQCKLYMRSQRRCAPLFNLLAGVLGHRVQGTSVLEPLYLRLVESMCELDVESTATLRVDLERHRLAYCDLCAHEINLVLGLNLVVVCRVDKCERKHALLLEIGLVLVYVS